MTASSACQLRTAQPFLSFFWRAWSPSRPLNVPGHSLPVGAETTFEGLADSVSRLLERFTAWANSQSAADIAADIRNIGEDIQSLWGNGVRAFRGLQLAWEAIRFPADIIAAPFKALISYLQGDPMGTVVQKAFQPLEDA